jgi:hypothetical protein
MKRLLLLVLLVAHISTTRSQDRVLWGVTGDVVWSKPLVSDLGNIGYSVPWKTSASIGGILRLPLEGHWFFEFAPSFIRMNAEVRETIDPWVFEISARADYLELPVYIGVGADEGPFSLFVFTGPSLAYKLAERWDIGFAAGPPPPFYARYDVAMHLGGGTSIQLLHGLSVLIQARYAFGLNQTNADGSGQMHSSGIRLGTGLLFNP